MAATTPPIMTGVLSEVSSEMANVGNVVWAAVILLNITFWLDPPLNDTTGTGLAVVAKVIIGSVTNCIVVTDVSVKVIVVEVEDSQMPKPGWPPQQVASMNCSDCSLLPLQFCEMIVDLNEATISLHLYLYRDST